MDNILHMSDIHYGRNTKLEKERLMSLAKYLNDQNIKIKFLVFTGDMIDAFVIRNECIHLLSAKYPSLKNLNLNLPTTDIMPAIINAGTECIQDYDSQISTLSQQKMQEAGDLYKSFVQEINVDSSHIVLCCGNHDCLYLANEPTYVKCNNQPINAADYKIKFAPYDYLCSILNSKLSCCTQTYCCDDYTFIISNCNWGNVAENNHRMCLDCYSLTTEIQAQQNKNSNKCLFLSHKPFDDVCDKIKFSCDDVPLTITEQITRVSTAFLYGDKHSHIVKDNSLKEFMCGHPLSEHPVHYNLIKYGNTGIQSSSYITYYEDEWRKGATNITMSEIYNISRPFLKSYSFSLLTHNPDIPEHWDAALKIIQNSVDNGRLELTSKMFSSCCNPLPCLPPNSSHFYDELISVLKGGSKMQAVGIKGYPSVGKSTFMTIFYLYMLREFFMGKIGAIPFYFDVRKISDYPSIQNTQDIALFTQTCIREFEKYLHSSIELSHKYNCPIWLIITGLEGSHLLDPGYASVEKNIYTLLESNLKVSHDKYIMGLNLHDYDIDASFDQIQEFENVYFLNPLRILQYKFNEDKLNSFLTAYLSLHNSCFNAEHVIKRLSKLHFVSADLSFMHYCLNPIMQLSSNPTTWQLLCENGIILKRIAEERFHLRLEKIQQVAGMLYAKKQRYCEIITNNDLKDVSISEYLNLCNHPLILNYLISKYYVCELIHYCNCTLVIPSDSILNCFITHDIAIMIRTILFNNYQTGGKQNLEHFIERHSKEMHSYLYSMIVYLCGHLKPEGGSDIINEISSSSCPKDFSFYEERSLALAQIVCEKSNHSMKNTFILRLIHDKDFREFHRIYQLYYFGDQKLNRINITSPLSSSIKITGFDFRSTFLVLLAKLDAALTENIPYPLFEIDLYTICDLIYSRLQKFSESGFFYNKKYNMPGDSECAAVLEKVVDLLEKYARQHKFQLNTNEQIIAYFKVMKMAFTQIKDQVNKASGESITKPYVSPSKDFEQICKLSTLPRIGWTINTKKISDNHAPTDDIQCSTQHFETIMEHIMESVYIAQMFLPEKLYIDGYDKHKIISIILYSDLGRISTGDYSPIYNNVRDFMSRETENLSYFLILGTLDEYADQPTYFSPIRDAKNEDINIQIALEIKNIQTEYKYYTLYSLLHFDETRRQDFESDFQEPNTNIGKAIRNILIQNNPNFQKYF